MTVAQDFLHRLTALFDAIDAGGIDPVVPLVAVLVAAVVVLYGLWRQAVMVAAAEEQRRHEQQRRAEEAECWLQLADEEVAAVRRRLADVERRHANLRAQYGRATRELLANNYYVIAQHVRRRKEAE